MKTAKSQSVYVVRSAKGGGTRSVRYRGGGEKTTWLASAGAGGAVPCCGARVGQAKRRMRVENG